MIVNKIVQEKCLKMKLLTIWTYFVDNGRGAGYYIEVDRDKNVNVEFHTAKVLAERLSMLKEIE